MTLPELTCELCEGVAVLGDLCVGHMHEDDLERYLRSLRLDARNAHIGPARARRIVNVLGAADIIFDGARFDEGVDFSGVQFLGRLSFNQARFGADADFQRCRFGADLDFRYVTSSASILLAECSFEGRVDLNVRAQLVDLNLSTFRGPVDITAAAAHVYARRARFIESLRLWSDESTVSLTGARFSAPAVVLSPEGGSRIETLYGTDLANLTLSGIDLSGCRFVGALNIDKLRIDGPPLFASTPNRWRWDWRLTLADEHAWRANYDRRPAGWYPPAMRPAADPAPRRGDRHGPEARDEAIRIQAAYRELRKSREDAKDEPGASDFYRGEMEMRRFAAGARGVPGRPKEPLESLLLTAYWAVSAYGQRASRALAALLVLLVLGTVGLATVGFGHKSTTAFVASTTRPGAYVQTAVEQGRPGVREAIYYSVESTTSLLRQPTEQPLTGWGRAVEIALRLLGPLLLGLALLALRGRVKR